MISESAIYRKIFNFQDFEIEQDIKELFKTKQNQINVLIWDESCKYMSTKWEKLFSNIGKPEILS